MPIIPDADKDIKEIRVAGCRVQLTFRAVEQGGWVVQGTVKSGEDDQASERSFRTAAYPTRDEAEQDALQQASDRLGNNVDRSSSRVKNYD
jgi:hypothetical protein